MAIHSLNHNPSPTATPFCQGGEQLPAISVKQVSKRFSGFGDIVRKAPYVSGLVIVLIGLYLGINGWVHLPHQI